MKKIHLIGLSLFAVFAFSAVAVVSSASALESVWLVNGLRPAEGVSVDSEGELLLEDVKEEVDLLCSGLNEGLVGGDASGNNPTWDEVTSITDLEGKKPILCKFGKNANGTERRGACEPEASSSPEAAPDGLPWLTELLLSGEKFLDDILGKTGEEAGWNALCLVLGININDLCAINTASADIDNETGGVIALFSPEIGGLANCTRGGVGQGAVEGEVLILTLSGLSLAVSEG